jgi:LPXTG-site transpeptidase (sortase) family protein
MSTSSNPLFQNGPQPDDATQQPAGYVLPGKSSRVEPINDPATIREAASGSNAAVNLIKEKLARLYDESEPNAQTEAHEAASVPVRSPHQQFMYELSTSGKSLAEIQTAWHNYYTNLPDDQKHQVWQEFYDANDTANYYKSTQPSPAPQPPQTAHTGAVVSTHSVPTPVIRDTRKPSAIRHTIRHHVQKRTAALSTAQKQNLHSLMFGLSTGFIVLLIFMFGFFNEVIIAPFIQPGRASATPIIIDNASIASSGKTEVIIPKINVEIPVIYGLDSNAESTIQNNLEDGVVHYPSTESPGQNGNVAIFGHSSNNIFNKGKYKFAFVLLHELRSGDVFYLTYNKQVYAYKVFMTKVVDPSEVGVLNDVADHSATATLITCDPPGTSRHRLVVVGEQISPDPAKNTVGTSDSATTAATPASQLAGNGPTLWSRFWNWLF